MISLIAAYNSRKVIGKEGKIPWHISDDLKRFKEITMGSPIIMGRKTWESIGKALPGRKNIVVTRGDLVCSKDVEVAHSLRSAVIGAAETYMANEIFIIGGAEIYEQAIPMVDKMYLTHVFDSTEGDAFFPEFDKEEWNVVISQEFPDHSFRILERRKDARRNG